MSTSIRSHPWASYLNTRGNFKITCNFEECDRAPAPHKFNDKNLIRSPDDYRVLTIRECITLDDVISFRNETNRLTQTKKKVDDVSSLTADLCNLSLEKKHFRVVYRWAVNILFCTSFCYNFAFQIHWHHQEQDSSHSGGNSLRDLYARSTWSSIYCTPCGTPSKWFVRRRLLRGWNFTK